MRHLYSQGRGLKGLYLASISGVLIILSQPPISLSIIAFIALIPILFSIEKPGIRENIYAGLVAGVISYAGLIYWVSIAMNRYGGFDLLSSTLIMLLLVAYLSIYTIIFAISIPYLRRSLSIPVYLSGPALWVILEYIRAIALTGFPWSLMAHSQYRFLSFCQIASITGTYFISYLIVAVNCIIYHVISSYQKRGGGEPGHRLWARVFPPSFVIYTAIICLLIIISLFYGHNRLKQSDHEDRRATIVQGNIMQNVKWDSAFRARTVMKYYRMTMASHMGTDIVIWPETAMPFIMEDKQETGEWIRRLATQIHCNLLFGAVSRDKEGRLYNSAYAVGRDGDVLGIYHKVHLVPFGEYTPLAEHIPFLQGLTAEGIGFYPGQGHHPIATSVGRLGILICYEGIFPEIARQTVKNGAQVLVNITNDAWYDRSSAPYQHFASYIFRAVETDRYILRAANTGISGIIDPMGRIKATTGIFEDAVLNGGFALKDGETFYVRHGDYFLLVIAFGFGLLILLRAFYLKRNRLKQEVFKKERS